MRLPVKILLLLLVAGAAAALYFHLPAEEEDSFNIYGNVEQRHISIAFENGGRVREMLVEEGQRVKAGQLLARQDDSALKLAEAQAEAQLAALEQVVLKLHNGARPEEKAQAEARVRAAEAQYDFALRQFRRIEILTGKNRAVSRQDRDSALSARDMAAAALDEARKARELMELGPRAEDIAQAEAQRDAAKAALAIIRRNLAQTELIAPRDALVRARLVEAGDMASAQRPAYQLLIDHPKWIRAYVPEYRLGHLRSGDKALIFCDSFPDTPVEGSVGYISSVAEFTPKSVQTEELRTALVYEVRILTEDPRRLLRLGMPVTVRLSPRGPEPRP